jgi:hypothetical protein
MASVNKQGETRRVTIPAELLELLGQVAEDMGVSERWALRWMFSRFLTLVRQGRGALFAPEFEQAWQALAATRMQTSTSVINYALLQRSPKLKSGYEGVYPYNRKWRAEAPDPADPRAMRTVSTHDSPDQAAWARHLYLKAHKLPYGRLAARLAYFRKIEPEVVKMLDAEGLRRLAIFEAAKAGEPIEDLDEADRQWEREDPSNLSIPGQIVKLEG